MPSSCCVPGCISNFLNRRGENVSVFSFPKDETRKRLWLDAIPRSNFVPTKRSAVCIHHFEERFVVRVNTIRLPDGLTSTVKRDRIKLTNDAVPTLYKNEQAASSTQSDSRCDTEIDMENKGVEVEDGILSFGELQTHWIPKFNAWKDSQSRNDVFSHFNKESMLYTFQITSTENNTPKIEASVIVEDDLRIRSYKNGIPMNDDQLVKKILRHGRLQKWSELFDVCSLIFDSTHQFDMTVQNNLDEINRLIDDISYKIDDNKTTDKLMFCKEQLRLAVSKKITYCSTLLAWFAAIFFSFPGAYKRIRQSNFLTMPHPVYLKTFTSKLGMGTSGIDDSHWLYLKKKINFLKDHERVCNLLLDEIYVKPELSYRGGKLEGVAANSSPNENSVTLATTIQSFMISSITKKNKEIVGLFPCKNLSTSYLHKTVLEILKMLTDIGYRVFTIISDNNSVNRSMFQMLCGGSLKTSFKNPYDESQDIFVLFDNVHIFKCIRNNWLNQIDGNQTFIIPEIDDLKSDKKYFACLSHLKTLHREEENNIVKLAPALSKKVLFPSSLERQNVNLCCRLFDEKNIAALKEKSKEKHSDYLGTIMFLEIILKWWKVVNVKHVFKGDRFRDPYQDAIFNLNDDNFLFLKRFLDWTIKWRRMNYQGGQIQLENSKNHGKLSDQTNLALTHTLQCLIDIVIHMKQKLKHVYVLLGKFQTDDLEERFGQYRLMSGACYNISVQQVLDSEKKLKAISMISLYSSMYMDVHLKNMFDFQFSEGEIRNITTSRPSVEDRKTFENVLVEADEICVSDETLLGLAYIGGYVCKNVYKTVNCENCKSRLMCNSEISSTIIPKENNFYFNIIDRGGLKYPSDTLINILILVFKVFNVLIGERYERDFLNACSQRSVIFHTIECALDSFKDEKCNDCQATFEPLINKCIFHFLNIVLNNYRKKVTEKCSKNNENSSKSSKKRKLDKLSS